MLGRHYPNVTAWSLWNEPNWHSLLQPQWRKRQARTRRGSTGGWCRAGSAALRATGHGQDMILLGETAPLGSNSRGAYKPLYAARFYRSLFCLTRKLKPQRHCGDYRKRGALSVSGVAHHPYPVVAPPGRRSRKEPDALRLADAGRFVRILDAARRYHRVGGRLPICYTEFGYQTKPPDPYRGVSLKRQAAYLARAERIAYRQKRALGFNQFLLRDSGPQTQYPASDRRYWSTYQTGLRFADGGEKPALTAYRLPFVRTGRKRVWGMVRPADNGVPQRVGIERYAGRRLARGANGDGPQRARLLHGGRSSRSRAVRVERRGVPLGREGIGSRRWTSRSCARERSRPPSAGSCSPSRSSCRPTRPRTTRTRASPAATRTPRSGTRTRSAASCCCSPRSRRSSSPTSSSASTSSRGRAGS